MSFQECECCKIAEARPFIGSAETRVLVGDVYANLCISCLRRFGEWIHQQPAYAALRRLESEMGFVGASIKSANDMISAGAAVRGHALIDETIIAQDEIRKLTMQWLQENIKPQGA